MGKKGGKQPGAGRPKGSTNVPRFGDYVTDAQRKEFVAFVLKRYKKDMRLATWAGDHLFMKPKQEIGGPDGGPIPVSISEAVAKKNGIKP